MSVIILDPSHIRVDDTSRLIFKSGTWESQEVEDAIMGTVSYSNRAGSTMVVRFIGTSISVLGRVLIGDPMQPSMTSYSISIDNGPTNSYELPNVASNDEAAFVYFESPSLPMAEHVLTLENKGVVQIDAFPIQGQPPDILQSDGSRIPGAQPLPPSSIDASTTPPNHPAPSLSITSTILSMSVNSHGSTIVVTSTTTLNATQLLSQSLPSSFASPSTDSLSSTNDNQQTQDQATTQVPNGAITSDIQTKSPGPDRRLVIAASILGIFAFILLIVVTLLILVRRRRRRGPQPPPPMVEVTRPFSILEDTEARASRPSGSTDQYQSQTNEGPFADNHIYRASEPNHNLTWPPTPATLFSDMYSSGKEVDKSVDDEVGYPAYHRNTRMTMNSMLSGPTTVRGSIGETIKGF